LEAYYGERAFYVHLTRDPEAVARSYNERWGMRCSIMDAFGYGVLLHSRRWSASEQLDVARFYVATVEENIRCFLRDKPRKAVVRLESFTPDFTSFWHDIQAQGELKQAIGEFTRHHNVNRPVFQNRHLRRVARWVKTQVS
jgi:hypothetical protein